jgi:hypothetical protein
MLSGLGLWHLFNHIRLFVSLPPTPPPSSYVAPAWFPAPRVRHLELIIMLAGGVYGFATQMLAYSPMPFNADGSIPPERLPNHEHAIMYASLLVYAGSAIYLDRSSPHRRRHTTPKWSVECTWNTNSSCAKSAARRSMQSVVWRRRWGEQRSR